MFLDSYRTVFTFLSWLDLLVVAVAFLVFIQKSSSNSKTTDRGLQI